MRSAIPVDPGHSLYRTASAGLSVVNSVNLRDYKDDLANIADSLKHSDIDLEIAATANRHGKPANEIYADIKRDYPIQWHEADGHDGNREKLTAGLLPHDCKILDLDQVTPEAIKWLWPGRIPMGMYSLIAGQPGVGKSTIGFSMAAIVSAGGTWPFTQDQADIGTVIILTAEDSAKCTIVPRLMASGADLTRVKMIQSVARLVNDEQVIDAPLLLSEDMAQLHAVLDQYPDTRLVMFDPLSAYLGVRDSHRDSDVRQVLGPLTDLAARHGVAILGVSHLSKNAAASAMSRVMGSTGIIAAARSAYLATRHEEELMLLPVKSNVAPGDMGGLTYEIQSATIAGDIETSCILWTSQTDVEADDALAQQSAKNSAPKKYDAINFLKEILADGPRPLSEINDEAEAEGIAWATVRRAYDDLKLVSIREKKFQGKWFWHTPEQAPEN